MKRFCFTVVLLLGVSFFIKVYCQKDNVNIRVVYPFNVTKSVLHLYYSSRQDINMTQSGHHEYSCELFNTSEFVFNIEYDIPEYGIYGHYIAGGNKYDGSWVPYRFDPHGIKYAKIYVNNQLIDNSFTIINASNSGLDIVVKVNDDKSIIPLQNPSYQHYAIDDRIPAGVPHHHMYRNTDFPGSGDVSINGWVVALSDNNSMNECIIEIDYTKVLGKKMGEWILLAENDYDIYTPGDDGGLFLRYPFFAIQEQLAPMPGTSNGNILTIYPGDYMKRVWHWWTPRYYEDSWDEYEAFKAECRLRIIGQGLVQGGIDFRNTNDDIHELGCSEWYYENNGEWQLIVFNTEDISTSISETENAKRDLDVTLSDNMIRIDYQNICPGNYHLQLFNSISEEVFSCNITITSSEGIWESEFKKSKDDILYYSAYSKNEQFSGSCTIMR